MCDLICDVHTVH